MTHERVNLNITVEELEAALAKPENRRILERIRVDSDFEMEYEGGCCNGMPTEQSLMEFGRRIFDTTFLPQSLKELMFSAGATCWETTCARNIIALKFLEREYHASIDGWMDYTYNPLHGRLYWDVVSRRAIHYHYGWLPKLRFFLGPLKFFYPSPPVFDRGGEELVLGHISADMELTYLAYLLHKRAGEVMDTGKIVEVGGSYGSFPTGLVYSGARDVLMVDSDGAAVECAKKLIERTGLAFEPRNMRIQSALKDSVIGDSDPLVGLRLYDNWNGYTYMENLMVDAFLYSHRPFLLFTSSRGGCNLRNRLSEYADKIANNSEAHVFIGSYGTRCLSLPFFLATRFPISTTQPES